MRRASLLGAVLTTLALAGVAGVARAETVQPVGTAQPLHLDQKGHWSLRLESSQPSYGRDLQGRDVQAGAYYHISPTLRVGAAMSFSNGPAQTDRTDLPPVEQAPRVKLETNFKF